MTKERNLFVEVNPSDVQEKISVAAHRLTIYFTDEEKLPLRYRKKSSKAKMRKIKEDAESEVTFQANVKSWTQLIDTMLSKLDNQQAWRFIDMSPEIDPTVQKLTDCKDFRDFVDYLILRRDKGNCDAEELGGLTRLLMPFQRKIEVQIQK